MQMVSPRHSASLPGSNGRCGWWIQPDAVRSTPASDNGSPSGCAVGHFQTSGITT